MNAKPFTEDEDRIIISLRACGYSFRAIGIEVDRDKDRVAWRLRELGAATVAAAKTTSPPLAPVMVTSAEAKLIRFNALHQSPNVTACLLGDPEPGRSHFDKLDDGARLSLAKRGRTR